jgi:hypothetical protein
MEPAAKDVDPGERLFSQMSTIFIMPEIERRNKGVRHHYSLFGIVL